MRDLSGTVAFVTGAGSGIGLAMAHHLAKAGAAVAIADIDPGASAGASEEIQAAGGRALAVTCDVTRPDSLEEAADRTVAELGPVQVLVNNAGAFTAARLEDTTPADWAWLLDVNVIGVVNGLHTFLPRMRSHGGPGHVLNTASISGHLAVAGLSTYTATKFAVIGLSEVLRLELEETAIGVSVLCPGVVKTDLLGTSRRHRDPKHGPPRADDGSVGSLIETGTDPDVIGALAVEGIQDGRFYIFTHPAVRGAFERRFQDILEAYPQA